MQLRSFGNNGPLVPLIGQGTWNIDHGDPAFAIDALRRGLDLGATHIDTAEMYGSGAAEHIVARAINGRRDDVFLVSKVLPSNASQAGTIAACERSLKRLETDYLDCYLLHWRGAFALEETFRAFETLFLEGKIRSWGVSNFDESDLNEAIKIAGDGQIACNQVLYHLRQRAIEHAVIPCCEAHNIAVVAYSPFGQNDFPDPQTPGGQVLSEIAKTHGATPRQVALRFLLRRDSVWTIPKASRPEHAVENACACEMRLSDAELARIDEAFPRGPRPRDLPML